MTSQGSPPSLLVNPQKSQMGFHTSHSYAYCGVKREASLFLKWEVVKKGDATAASEVYAPGRNVYRGLGDALDGTQEPGSRCAVGCSITT